MPEDGHQGRKGPSPRPSNQQSLADGTRACPSCQTGWDGQKRLGKDPRVTLSQIMKGFTADNQLEPMLLAECPTR